jgi:hypothetical protein
LADQEVRGLGKPLQDHIILFPIVLIQYLEIQEIASLPIGEVNE